MVNGQLKVEAEIVGTPKTNLYAIDKRCFFKSDGTEIEYLKGADGKIEKAIVNMKVSNMN